MMIMTSLFSTHCKFRHKPSNYNVWDTILDSLLYNCVLKHTQFNFD